MKRALDPHHRHRFPAEIISHAVWLYHTFCLSFRDVELMLAERGIEVSYETIQRWCRKFAQTFQPAPAASAEAGRPLAFGRGVHQDQRRPALSVARHGPIHQHSHPRRHRMSATEYRAYRTNAFEV
jgi:hypothetical protein